MLLFTSEIRKHNVHFVSAIVFGDVSHMFFFLDWVLTIAPKRASVSSARPILTSSIPTVCCVLMTYRAPVMMTTANSKIFKKIKHHYLSIAIIAFTKVNVSIFLYFFLFSLEWEKLYRWCLLDTWSLVVQKTTCCVTRINRYVP